MCCHDNQKHWDAWLKVTNSNSCRLDTWIAGSRQLWVLITYFDPFIIVTSRNPYMMLIVWTSFEMFEFSLGITTANYWKKDQSTLWTISLINIEYYNGSIKVIVIILCSCVNLETVADYSNVLFVVIIRIVTCHKWRKSSPTITNLYQPSTVTVIRRW